MSFCGKCGRQRTGDARFCGGCGTEFRDAAGDTSAPAGEPLTNVRGPVDVAPPADIPEPAGWPEPAQDIRWDPPASGMRWDPVAPDAGWEPPVEATRMDLAPEPTRFDLPGPDQPDPFASWFAPGTPPEQPTETVFAYRANSATGYSQPAPPAPTMPPQPPYTPTPDRRSSGGRRALWIVVPLVAILAGGAAFALVKTLGKHPAAQSTPPAVKASTPAASPPLASSSGTASGTASATAAASTSVTATPSPSLVAIAPGVGSSAATTQVQTLLSQYFEGINTHNYAEYSSTLTAQNQANQPQSSFESGYSTTTDSGITLTSLTATGGGDLTATVTFTSHQSPADSVDNSACNNWTVNYYLVPNGTGTGYLISPAPSGYQPTYSDC